MHVSSIVSFGRGEGVAPNGVGGRVSHFPFSFIVSLSCEARFFFSFRWWVAKKFVFTCDMLLVIWGETTH